MFCFDAIMKYKNTANTQALFLKACRLQGQGRVRLEVSVRAAPNMACSTHACGGETTKYLPNNYKIILIKLLQKKSLGTLGIYRLFYL